MFIARHAREVDRVGLEVSADRILHVTLALFDQILAVSEWDRWRSPSERGRGLNHISGLVTIEEIALGFRYLFVCLVVASVLLSWLGVLGSLPHALYGTLYVLSRMLCD